MQPSLRLDAREREQLANLGYVVRESALAETELARLRGDCEAMVKRVSAASAGRRKVAVGSYMFQLDRGLVTIVKWEPAHPEVVQGVEPFAHFDDALRAWAADARFVEPIKDVVGCDAVELFTEKLNVKRAHTGGPIVLHQDYPYWTENSDGAGEIATAIVFLDDATRENGCLEVAPGSHRGGVRERRAVDGFGALEMDTQRFDESQLRALELPAGSVAFFGSLLVHRSLPNRSDADRRALLYSYQPAGRRKAIEGFLKLAGR
ncbi:MAG TPA: phytanoyl-CoA dioxygenase family protein [Myxococcota bacterium]|jgi:ectoine hydroxylase-related dioxygenase (phytanoyl-CoA dioxygenase family)